MRTTHLGSDGSRSYKRSDKASEVFGRGQNITCWVNRLASGMQRELTLLAAAGNLQFYDGTPFRQLTRSGGHLVSTGEAAHPFDWGNAGTTYHHSFACSRIADGRNIYAPSLLWARRHGFGS